MEATVKCKICGAKEKLPKESCLYPMTFYTNLKHIKGRTATPELFLPTIAFAPLSVLSCFSHLDCISRPMLHTSVRSLPMLLSSFNMYSYLVHSVIQSDKGLIPRNGLHYCVIVSPALAYLVSSTLCMSRVLVSLVSDFTGR